MKQTLAILWLLTATSSAGIKEQETIPGLKLRLEAQLHITDKHGVVQPSQVASALVGQLVVIYRTDGFKYDAQVTEIEEREDMLKIYGRMLNVEDSSFGFVMHKGGTFAGAIVERKNERTYALEISPEHKGYIFVRTTKYDKPSASNKDIEDSVMLVDWSNIEPKA